jgi:hypothetical protein
MVNPTYLTAKSTLFMLAGAGYEDAKRIIGALGTQDEMRKNAAKDNCGKSLLSDKDRKELFAGTTTAIVALYEAVSRFIIKEGVYQSL